MSYNGDRDLDNKTLRVIENMSDLMWALNDGLKLTNIDIPRGDYIYLDNNLIVHYNSEEDTTSPFSLSLFNPDIMWEEYEEKIVIGQYCKYDSGVLSITPLTYIDDLKDYLVRNGYSSDEYEKWSILKGTEQEILERLKEDMSFKDIYKIQLDNIMQSIDKD